MLTISDGTQLFECPACAALVLAGRKDTHLQFHNAPITVNGWEHQPACYMVKHWDEVSGLDIFPYCSCKKDEGWPRRATLPAYEDRLAASIGVGQPGKESG